MAQRFTAEMKEWVYKNLNKHLCKCGCGDFVEPTRWRWYNGKNLDYIQGHNPSSYTRSAKLNPLLGKYKSKNGYVFILKPEHPSARSKGYVREHRLIAEQKIGRCLRRDEDVHHINGDKSDNRPENLEVLTKSEHHLLHARRNENHPMYVKVNIKRLVRLRKQGFTFKQLSEKLKISINTVRDRLRKAGLV